MRAKRVGRSFVSAITHTPGSGAVGGRDRAAEMVLRLDVAETNRKKRECKRSAAELAHLRLQREFESMLLPRSIPSIRNYWTLRANGLGPRRPIGLRRGLERSNPRLPCRHGAPIHPGSAAAAAQPPARGAARGR